MSGKRSGVEQKEIPSDCMKKNRANTEREFVTAQEGIYCGTPVFLAVEKAAPPTPLLLLLHTYMLRLLRTYETHTNVATRI